MCLSLVAVQLPRSELMVQPQSHIYMQPGHYHQKPGHYHQKPAEVAMEGELQPGHYHQKLAEVTEEDAQKYE